MKKKASESEKKWVKRKREIGKEVGRQREEERVYSVTTTKSFLLMSHLAGTKTEHS